MDNGDNQRLQGEEFERRGDHSIPVTLALWIGCVMAVVVTLALGGLVYVYRFAATEKARSDRAAEVSRELAITTRKKRFEETTFKTYQDAFAGMSEWEVSRVWVYESKPGERLKLEAFVMLSRNGPLPDERYVFDARYETKGGECPAPQSSVHFK